MKCSSCGYDYPSKLSGCIRCGHKAARTTLKPSQTKLLEFPLKQRMAEQQEQSKPPVPAWRAELSERVREIRAKKEGVDTARPLSPAAPAVIAAEPARPVASPAKAQPVITSP